MAAGCAVDATGTYFVLFSFSRNFNNFQSLFQHSVVTTLWITREAISHPSRGWTGLSKATVYVVLLMVFFLSPVTSSIKHPDILPANARIILKFA